MTGRIYVRDLEILLALSAELGQFSYGTYQVIDAVSRSIQTMQERLHARASQWQSELRRRESALQACQQSEEEPDCRAAAIAVREAQEAVAHVRRLITRSEQAAGEYGPQASHLKQTLDGHVSKGKSDLERSIYKYKAYLAYASRASSGPHYDSHGADYQRERHKFILNTIKEHPALSNVSSSIRGVIATEVRRTGGQGYLHSPRGFHVGHIFPGWNHWSNYHWEESGMNSYRGGKQKR